MKILKEKFHPKFENYIRLEFEKSNAKISMDDLRKYAKRFGIEEWHNPAIW